MSSVPMRCVSFADNRSTYVPAVEKIALVTGLLILLKVTRPGPLTWLQNVDTVAPTGKPSSATVPFRLAVFGNVIVWFGPAFTIGAAFAGNAVTVTSSLAECSESLAVKRNTYSPATVKLASVTGEFGFVKATSPGPLTFDQLSARFAPRGKPSSQAVPLSFAASGSVTV